MASLAIAHWSRGPAPLHATQAVSNGVANRHGGDGWAFAPLGLGFEQISSRHIARVLRGATVHAFEWPPLSRHAAFPFGFRVQVGRVTHEYPLELLLTKSGIQPQVARRTRKMPSCSRADRSNGRCSISGRVWPVRSAACSARRSTRRGPITGISKARDRSVMVVAIIATLFWPRRRGSGRWCSEHAE